MATSSYCGRHGIDYHGSECPRCINEEQHRELLIQQEREHEETLDALLGNNNNQFNPGEYDCPHCLFRSLRRGASKCPLCHGNIDSEYWVQVQKREKSDEVRRAEEKRRHDKELERIRPERERLALEQEKKSTRQKRLEKFDAVFNVFLGFLGCILFFFFVFLVPYLSAWSTSKSPGVGSFGLGDGLRGVGGNNVNPLMFVPVFNWMILAVYMVFGQYGSLVWKFTKFWAMCGVGCGAGGLVAGLLIFVCLRQSIKSG
jgi:hypothetical protein